MKTQLAILSATLILGGSLIVTGCNRTTVQGPGNTALTVEAPAAPVVVKRGNMQTVEVSIVREGFSDPVKVDLTDLPRGVTARQPARSIETNKATFILDASDKADLVANHRAKVTAVGPDGATATQYVSIVVTE